MTNAPWFVANKQLDHDLKNRIIRQEILQHTILQEEDNKTY